MGERSAGADGLGGCDGRVVGRVKEEGGGLHPKKKGEKREKR